MSDSSILGQVALGYSPFIDRKRVVTATRLTVFPVRRDQPLRAEQLLAAVGEVWPAGGGRVSLNIASEGLLADVLRFKPPTNLMIEVPAFMACSAANAEALLALRKAGTTLLIKGRPLTELPREVLPCFAYSVIDVADDRRTGDAVRNAPTGVVRSIGHVLSGVRTMAELETGFQRGAVAVLGWPIDDPVLAAALPAAGSGKAGVPRSDLQTVVELINLADRSAPVEQLEAVLKRDPALAFRLMRYVNSPAFGLSVEIGSFRHAVMLLGYQRIKRWLALLLATASADPNMKPVMFASIRRGLLMEELVRDNADDAVRGDMFICGVFSLLHRLFGQPLEQLMRTIPVAPRVVEALVGQGGPFRPYLELVLAIEAESLFDVRAAADALMMSVQEINRAQLRALAAAAQFD